MYKKIISLSAIALIAILLFGNFKLDAKRKRRRARRHCIHCPRRKHCIHCPLKKRQTPAVRVSCPPSSSPTEEILNRAITNAKNGRYTAVKRNDFPGKAKLVRQFNAELTRIKGGKRDYRDIEDLKRNLLGE